VTTLGRPSGSFGPVSVALRQQAAAAPGTVRDLAHRAQVGVKVARYTASRLLERGELVALQGSRPAVLSVPGGPPAPAVPHGRLRTDPIAFALDMLDASFWQEPGCGCRAQQG